MTATTAGQIREAHRFGAVDPDALLIDTLSLGAMLEQRAREQPDALFLKYFDDDAGAKAFIVHPALMARAGTIHAISTIIGASFQGCYLEPPVARKQRSVFREIGANVVSPPRNAFSGPQTLSGGGFTIEGAPLGTLPVESAINGLNAIGCSINNCYPHQRLKRHDSSRTRNAI